MARPKFASDDVDRIMLRFPPGLRERVASAATANNRSINSEIVATLEEKYPAPIIVNSIDDVIDRVSAAILDCEDEKEKTTLKEILQTFYDAKRKITADEEKTGRRYTQIRITPRSNED